MACSGHCDREPRGAKQSRGARSGEGTRASRAGFDSLSVSRGRDGRADMAKIVVITGAGAGVGRACVTEFARHGCDVALLSRDPDRLEAAAARIEAELGPIDVWVNVAMATVFAPV